MHGKPRRKRSNACGRTEAALARRPTWSVCSTPSCEAWPETVSGFVERRRGLISISQARPRSNAAALLGLADRDLQDALHQALNTLSQRQREIVILRWNHRLTYEQIGVKLGIAPGTAAAHMQRAIAHLKAVLPLPLGDRSRVPDRDRVGTFGRSIVI